MDGSNSQAHTEDWVNVADAWPTSSLRTTSKRTGVEPTISGVSQAVFPDAAGMDDGMWNSAAPGGPEEGPDHTAAAETWLPELRSQKLRPETGPGKMPSTGTPLEAPGEQQEGQNETKPGGEQELLPPTVPEVRDIKLQSQLENVQGQPQERMVAIGPQNFGTPWQGFMKCLLEVGEEEEAMHRRVSKVRGPIARKLPRNLTPMPTSGSVSISTPSLPLTLAQTYTSTTPMALSRARPTAPGPVSVPMGTSGPTSVPSAALPVQEVHLPWRRADFLHQSYESSLSYFMALQQQDQHSPLTSGPSWEDRAKEQLTQKQEEAFRSYFEIFDGHGEVDARSLENTLLLVGISLTPAQVEDALISADINGDGHVDFKDFLAVMTDTKRFFCSVEQNVLTDVTPPNPHTLLFEILSLMVEMLALPEAAMEEITKYYHKKLKEATCKTSEAESTLGRLQFRRKLPYNPHQADNVEAPERRVLRILSRLKQQNTATNLQSPYSQVPCIPLYPRLDKKVVRGKPNNMSPDIRSLLYKTQLQGGREHSSDGRKWLSPMPARTH
ncbi:spermatogenesis-associated protein 21 [Echinops telfairi]|uniref:Spermatogenesis-associated protein 21 n=1 Tax=Echinops telfairi TaxID=9371 RepID=A0ABM0ZR16_ECHTE|nr:spermatogenesis-associated protein 21 [Echinops telfairi]